MQVYLNGELVPYERAMVPVEDRGFVFADGVYEVIRCYAGRPFRLGDHLDRLALSAAAVRLPLPWSPADLERAVDLTLAANGLDRGGAAVYLQVTRGPAPRTHVFPAAPRPTLVIIARPETGPDPSLREGGVAVLTAPDLRWHLCHVKSTGLLYNVLVKQRAAEAGCYEALLVRDGLVTEGTASNAFVVLGGLLHTHPEGPHILSGVTRRVTLELAADLGIPVREEPVAAADLKAAEEVFLTGTITEIMPIVRVDGSPVGAGRPGPVTRRLQEAFSRLVAGGPAGAVPGSE